MKKGATTRQDYNDLLLNIIKKTASRDEFSVRLTPQETFALRSRIHLSDGDLKIMKSVFKKSLGFDVLSSRCSVAELRKKCDTSDNYDIVLLPKEKIAEQGNKEKVDTVRVTMKDVEKGISRRVEDLEKSNRLVGVEDQLTLCLSGDKGADETKLCLSIENVSNPNTPDNLMLVCLYEGHDNEEELQANAQDVLEQWNRLDKITYYSKDGIPLQKK
uniref:Uncharacterized protein n=2 Tax=Caenorhabditis japonica TaxID=281687 RepID=A0A8R1HPM2_CAEJA